ncbi:MAG: acyltransferase [Rhizobiales bacterium]|nr:acyltransferase [Hyphomicrobiales bacterium]
MPAQRKPSAAIAKPSGRVDALDLLRLLAVAAVVLYHFGFNGPTANGTTYVALPGIGGIARYGYLGVQLFFVVSGFVIAFSAQGRTASEFLIARISRIYPAFLFCMTLTVLASVLFGGPEFHVSAKQYIANLFIAAPALGQPYVDLVYWTLILELTFYAWIFALMLTNQMQKLPTVILPAWLSISLVNEVFVHSHALTKVLLTDQSGFFATGVLLYELYRGRSDLMTRVNLMFAASVAVTQGVLNSYLMAAEFKLLFDPYVVAAICIAIILLAFTATRAERMPLPAEVVLALGGLTYPLYLFHAEIGYVAFVRLGGQQDQVATVTQILSSLAVAALLIWRYVDRPGQKWTRKWLTAAVANLSRNPLAIRSKTLFSFSK